MANTLLVKGKTLSKHQVVGINNAKPPRKFARNTEQLKKTQYDVAVRRQTGDQKSPRRRANARELTPNHDIYAHTALDVDWLTPCEPTNLKDGQNKRGSHCKKSNDLTQI